MFFGLEYLLCSSLAIPKTLHFCIINNVCFDFVKEPLKQSMVIIEGKIFHLQCTLQRNTAFQKNMFLLDRESQRLKHIYVISNMSTHWRMYCIILLWRINTWILQFEYHESQCLDRMMIRRKVVKKIWRQDQPSNALVLDTDKPKTIWKDFSTSGIFFHFYDNVALDHIHRDGRLNDCQKLILLCTKKKGTTEGNHSSRNLSV